MVSLYIVKFVLLFQNQTAKLAKKALFAVLYLAAKRAFAARSFI